jgi:hypothetical protein
MYPAFVLAIIAQPVTIDVYPRQWAGWVPRWLLSSGDEITQFMDVPGLEGLVGQTGVPMLRWGGIAAEYWDWEGFDYEGAYYVDFFGSGIQVLPAPGSVDDLLQFCEAAGVEPILTVNHQINDPDKAARLVEYCNGGTGTPMGALRAQRGHPAPYDVTFWCIGNEPDIAGSTFPTAFGTWTFYRHFGIPFESWGWTDSIFCSSSQFGSLVGVYADAMRTASPIPLEIGGLSLAGDDSWIPAVIGPNAAEIDWVDAHYYPIWVWETDSTLYHDLLWAPDSAAAGLEARYSSLRSQLDEASGGYDIPLWILEYNVAVMSEDAVWWNYLDGLVIADCIGHLANAGAPAAAVYSIAEGNPGEFPLFGQIRTDTLSMRMGGYALQLLSERFGSTLVETDCAAAKEAGLEAWSSLAQDGRVAILAINRDLSSGVDAHLELHYWTPGSSFEVWQITNDAPMQAPFNGTTGVVYGGLHACGPSGLDWTFPRASLTCIQVIPPTSAEEGGGVRESLSVAPNPSAGQVTISIRADDPGRSSARIYDAAGRLVRVLGPGTVSEGICRILWDGSCEDGLPAPAGAYEVLLRLPDGTDQRAGFVVVR